MINIDNSFLSTFIHELLNAVNGVQAIAQVLANSSPLDSEEIVDSAADLMALTDRAQALINKLRILTNPTRARSSKRLTVNMTVKELINKIAPEPGQLPNSLKVTTDNSLDSMNLIPPELFIGFAEPLIYVLLHDEDDAYVRRQSIKISYQDQPQSLFNFDVSNLQHANRLSSLETIEDKLVLRSRFGFELKALYYMTKLFDLKIICNETTPTSLHTGHSVQVLIPN